MAQQTLNEAELIRIVRTYHPVVKQTGVAIEEAEAEVLMARGAFDPTLNMDMSQKDFASTRYYSYRGADINIPTWFGINFEAGIEDLQGDRLNPERSTSLTNYAGIRVPLMKNLAIDKRRAFLRQAKVMTEQRLTEQQAIVNDILYDALAAYWQWVQFYQRTQILNNALQNATSRLAFTKSMINLGERPAIDSIEALSQVQTIEILRNDAAMDARNALILLSTFTWLEDDTPYELPDQLQPDTNAIQTASIQFDLTSLSAYEERMLASHPELRVYDSKFNYLKINKQLKFQEMLPKLDLKYNFLGKGSNVLTTPEASLLQQNYQYGIAFAVPLRLSEGRAAYKLAQLKIKDTQFELDLKRRQLLNKVREYYNTMQVMQNQIGLQRSLFENQQRLTVGEDTRFRNGESSLFLINSRELKQIETEQKLIETVAKYNKQKAAMQWVIGALGQ
jgi:outer membrane protein TolC